jgi:Skp family chaperone for outer membrane proteins
MRKILILSAVAAATATPTVAQAQRAATAIIVVVDSNTVYRDCNACRTAAAQLQAQVTAYQNRQQTLVNQLKPESDAIQAAVTALAGKQPDAALRSRAQAFQQKQEQAQQELARTEQNIQSIRTNVSRQIDARYAPAVRQVMTQQGANLALDVGSTIAHAPAVDVTAAVLAALNATLPSLSVTPMPQQQQQQQPQGR